MRQKLNDKTKRVRPSEAGHSAGLYVGEAKTGICDMNSTPKEGSEAPEEVSVVPVHSPPAKTRFIFDKDTCLALLYEVQLHGAHLYTSGKKQMMFEKVREGFLNSREYKAMSNGRPAPPWRTLADRVFKMARDRKAFVSLMRKKSGVEEEYGEKERILDAINEDMQQKKEKDMENKREASARADALKEAGETTRAMATNCSDDGSPPQKKARKSVFGVDNASDVLSSTIERQLKLDEERLQLEKDRLALASKQAEDARAQQDQIMELMKMLVQDRNRN